MARKPPRKPKQNVTKTKKRVNKSRAGGGNDDRPVRNFQKDDEIWVKQETIKALSGVFNEDIIDATVLEKVVHLVIDDRRRFNNSQKSFILGSFPLHKSDETDRILLQVMRDLTEIAGLIDGVKVLLKGRDHPTVVSNFMITLAACELAQSLPRDNKPLFDALYKYSVKLADTKDSSILVTDSSEFSTTVKDPQWYYPKFTALATFLQQRREIFDYALNYLSKLPNSSESEISAIINDLEKDVRAGGKSIQQLIEELADLINYQARYTIKPVLYQDGSFHHKDDHVALLDFDRSSYGMQDRELTYEFLATVGLFSTPPQNIEFHSELRETADGTGGVKFIKFPPGFKYVMHVDHDGELYCASPTAPISVRKVFEECKKPRTYEMLRMVTLLRICDQLIPDYVIDHEQQMQKRSGAAVLETQGDKYSAEKLLTTYFRRKKLIADPKTIETTLYEIAEDELTTDQLLSKGPASSSKEDAEQTQSASKKPRRFLGRVGHVRRLREGEKPSPQARANALEVGIVIDENGYVLSSPSGSLPKDSQVRYTWVKKKDAPDGKIHFSKAQVRDADKAAAASLQGLSPSNSLTGQGQGSKGDDTLFKSRVSPDGVDGR